MDLSTIEMDRDEARERLTEYQQSLRHERNAEDEAIAAAYRAASRGLPVISLPRTIAAGGFHPGGLPKLAVAPATALEVFCRWHSSDLVFADRDDINVNRGALVGRHSVRVTIPGDDLPPNRDPYWRAGSAMVPLIPPRFRPLRRSRLQSLHVLWEVDKWAWVAPEDPALVRHIRGDVWAVLATWDLTEIERAVLSQPSRPAAFR